MRVRPLLWLACLVALALWSPACVDSPYIFGRCSVTSDCRTWYNYLGGTVCTDGYCMCHDPSDVLCCPDGGQDCAWDAYECRSELRCQGGVDIVKIAPGGACTADVECRNPVDRRCGPPVCRNGYCGYTVDIGEYIESQYIGDCVINWCDVQGEVQKQTDPSDVPYDLDDCTIEACIGNQAVRQPAPDGTLCEPGAFCVFGKCVQCFEPQQAVVCAGPALCDWDTCTPIHCKDGVVSGDESAKDCGGPSCRPCPDGDICTVGSDCASGVCVQHICQEPTHADGVKNAWEGGIDCGYPMGPSYSCKDGDGCNGPIDCVSQVCYHSVCQAPTCLDDRKNGDETGTDCGGSCPPCH